MANTKYIRGISGRGFRVKNSAGAWKTVKEGAATNTLVDLDMVSTQDILSRERDNFVRVAGSGTTTAVVQSLQKNRGLRLRPAGGTFTVTQATPAVFTKTAHGYVAGDALVFSTTGALLTGLTAGTTYYVIATGLTANAFQVSATPGGTAVATTSTQSGTHTVTAQLRSVVPGEAITVDLNDGSTKRSLKRMFGRWVAASGGTVDIAGLQDSRLAGRVADPTLTLEFAGADNDLTFEALGSGGELVTIELADLGVDNATEDVTVDGTDIQVSLAVTQNVQATATPVQAGANNDLVYTAVPAGIAGNDVTIAYVMPADTNVVVPLAIDVTGTDIEVSLAVAADGSTVTTTGDLLKAAILADAEASALVTVADAAANDGSGLLVAVAETSLTGGVDYALSSTAAEVVTAIEGDAGADALVSVTAQGDGSGLVAVTAPSAIGADPEGLGRGEVVTGVDLTSPFNLAQLRRHFKAWVEN